MRELAMARLSESSKCLNGERVGDPNSGSIAFLKFLRVESGRMHVSSFQTFQQISWGFVSYFIIFWFGLELQHRGKVTSLRSYRWISADRRYDSVFLGSQIRVVFLFVCFSPLPVRKWLLSGGFHWVAYWKTGCSSAQFNKEEFLLC